MQRLSHHLAKSIAPALVVLLVGSFGCQNQNASAGRPPEEMLPVDQAWAKLKRDQEKSLLGGMIKVNGKPIDQAARDASREQERKANSSLGAGITSQAFDDMVGDVRGYLVKELPAAPSIKAAQNKQVLVVDKVANATGTRSTMLDATLESLRIKLANSEEIRSNFVLLSPDVAEGQEAIKRARAGQPWEYNNGLDPRAMEDAKLRTYHPDSIYKISGKMFQDRSEVKTKHRLLLRMNVEVWHPRSGQTIRAQDFTREYRFHPYRLDWISAEEDDSLHTR